MPSIDDDIWQAWKLTLEFGRPLADEAAARFSNAIYFGGSLGKTREDGMRSLRALALYLHFRYMRELVAAGEEVTPDSARLLRLARTRVLSAVAGFLTQDSMVTRTPTVAAQEAFTTPQTVRAYLAGSLAASAPRKAISAPVMIALAEVTEPLEAECLAVWITGALPPVEGVAFVPTRVRMPRVSAQLERRIARALVEVKTPPEVSALPRPAMDLHRFLKMSLEALD